MIKQALAIACALLLPPAAPALAATPAPFATPAHAPTPSPTPRPMPVRSPDPAELSNYKRQMLAFERRQRDKLWAFDDELLKERRALEDGRREALRQVERDMAERAGDLANHADVQREYTRRRAEIEKDWLKREEAQRDEATRRRAELNKQIARERQEFRMNLKD